MNDHPKPQDNQTYGRMKKTDDRTPLTQENKRKAIFFVAVSSFIAIYQPFILEMRYLESSA